MPPIGKSKIKIAIHNFIGMVRLCKIKNIIPVIMVRKKIVPSNNLSIKLIIMMKQIILNPNKKTSSIECSQRYIAYISEITSSNYFFLADFSNNNPAIDTWAFNTKIQFITINPEYSKFLLGLRYFFVAISIIANFFYIRRIKMIPYSDLVIEQKLIFVMGILLILFNDPFAGATALYPNMARF